MSSKISSSFRDPSGFLFTRDGIIYRQINNIYKDDYNLFVDSGLYKALVADKLVIPHEEVDIERPEPQTAFKIIRPEQLQFISYPYEWSFSQLKDAALTTLNIQTKAMEFGMSLKDSSAYNIQFWKGKPVLIDTLSFEKYREGQPWVAYRQFCQHFLAPLVLMSCKDIRLNQLLKIYIDGIPLDLASSLLDRMTYLKPSLLTHIHLHAKSQKHYADKQINAAARTGRVGRMAFLGIISSLSSAVQGLRLKDIDTEWGNYYEDTNYSSGSFGKKKELIDGYISEVNPRNVWDVGANTGVFSRIAAKKSDTVISCDIDPMAVEINYRGLKKDRVENILPFLLDLTNPSPGIGWANDERMSLTERGPADAVLALALIHHLAISNNLPFEKIAAYLNGHCRWLIIEFVPKSDSQVQRLLASRVDIFPDYTKESFEKIFSSYFRILKSDGIPGSERTLYLMEKK